ncbi:MAG TPA: BatD family protein [Rhodanobacter sp.]|nr:BatD family protein [Rhodanobacter sp.]
MFRRIIRCGLLALLLLPALGRAADVQATLDRNSVQLGDTVTLNLRVNHSSGNVQAPDLGALNKDFEILGTSQNSSLSVVNGTATSTLTFGIALRPRHEGVLQIPALTVDGSQTAPLQLRVTAASPTAAASAGADVFMEAQVEPRQAYVGQQLSYVVRLYYAVNISGGSLDTPQIDGVDVSRAGNDLNYDAERGGRQYHVLERRYALVPQHAGQLDIPALNFQGDAVDPNDPNSFFGASTPVSARAPAQTVEVRATPAGWGNAAWLPARQLSLTLDGWPGAGDQVRVGQPLNVTLNLQATGLPFEALPALSLPSLDGATVYPDKPVTGTRDAGPWLVGHRQQAFAIVPERAGTLTVPAITLKWWNVLTDRMEVAQIPAHSVTVLPVLPSMGGMAAHPSGPAVAVATNTSSATPTATTAATHVVPWRWLALGSIGLWLLSLLGWWWWRGRGHSPSTAAPVVLPATSARRCQQAFLDAAMRADTAAQVRTLLAWARAERPAIQHLGELAALLGDDRQRAAITALQQRHYAGAPVAVDGAVVAEPFKRGFAWRRDDDADADTGDLPPLYPFKLR